MFPYCDGEWETRNIIAETLVQNEDEDGEEDENDIDEDNSTDGR